MPIDFKPHDYQIAMANFMLANPRCAEWVEMGMGKSAVTLTVINELQNVRWAAGKFLIIAPKKVAEATWQNEKNKWNHLTGLKISTILGSERQRLAALYAESSVYVINRDNVQWLVDTLGNDWFFDGVVLDEASSFKNPQAKRFKKLKAVIRKARFVYELTGTPAPRDLMDLWAQIFLLDGGERLGKTITAYREQWFSADKRNATTVFSYKAKDGSEDDIKARLSDICMSLKASDYLNMPELVIDDIPVVLSPAARRQYDEMEKRLVLEVLDKVIDAGTAAALRIKLLQFAAGAVYDSNRAVAYLHDDKLDAFMELVDGLDGQHALVLYNFQHDRDRLVLALKKANVKVREYKCPQDQDDWNAGKIEVLLGHPASISKGLNLQEDGCHEIWFGLTDNLEDYLQTIARLRRQGQKKGTVFVHRLIVQDSVDEDVAAGLDNKEAFQECLLQAMKARIEKWRNA